MHKDSEGFDSHVLRFSARLVENGKVDVKRKFVVAYILSDDNILVTLVPEQNSGNQRFHYNYLQRLDYQVNSGEV